MRDNHDRMPELLGAYERDGNFFGAVAVTLASECRQFEFGVPRDEYIALRRILQYRPFDQLPGLQYRYFLASLAFRTPKGDIGVFIRVEQGNTSRQYQFQVPQSLGKNFVWFAQLTDFAAASHLNAPQPI
jgi:hypothetical protein